MPARSTVAVVDDSEVIRELIRVMLEDIHLRVATYASAHEFLASADGAAADCLVLDVRMPGMSGLALQRDLLARRWLVPIIFVSAHGSVPIAVEAMRHGAVDFLCKPFAEQQLIDAVHHAIANGQRRREQERRHGTLRARLALLTTREREVLRLTAAGQRTKEIAQALQIGVRTVEEYRTNLLRKMHATTMLELVHMAGRAEALEDGAAAEAVLPAPADAGLRLPAAALPAAIDAASMT